MGDKNMKFTAHDIYRLNENNIFKFSIDPKMLFNRLNLYPRIDDKDSSFAPLYIHQYENCVLGTLVQSYKTVLTKFDESVDTKEEIELDDSEINDKTFFYIDCEDMRIYIQSKRYPSTLNKELTLARLQKIVGDSLEKDVAFIKAEIRYTIEEIDEIFTRSFVKRICFKNLEGLELPEGAELHNPRKDLDKSLTESWNVYSKNTVDSMELKAKDGEKLSKNPLAKLGMLLSLNNRYKQVFKSMDIIDDGEKLEIKPTGNEHKVIYVSKKTQEDSYETYDKILRKTNKSYRGRFDE